MTYPIRRIAAVLSIALLPVCGIAAGTAPAQAAAPAAHSTVVAPAPRPTTMFVYNNSGQTIQLSVFARIEAMHTKVLEPGEVWQLPETFTSMNELTVRFLNDPNYAFLGHFSYDAGAFHILDARTSHVSYRVISGRTHGVAFFPASAGHQPG